MRTGTRPDPELLRARLRRLAGLDEPTASGPARQEPGREPEDGGPRHGSEPARPAGRMLTVAAMAAVLVAGWLTWHSGGDAPPTVITAAVEATPSAAAAPGPSGSPTATELVVQVVGAVRRPGVVRLPAGSRVLDAVAAAGGVRPGRSTGAVNLARRVVDGEQIVVGPKAVPGGGATTGPSEGATGVVDLNVADAAALDTLPGVGPVTAAAILRWRDEHGGFASVEQLQEVDGIGPKTYAQLAPLVVVAGS